MDKKHIEYPSRFDKKEYDKKYRKENYKSFSTVVRPDIKERIDNYCSNEKISKSEFLRRAIEMFENNE